MHLLFLVLLWSSVVGDAFIHWLFLAFPELDVWETPRTNFGVAVSFVLEILVIYGLVAYGIY